MPTPVRERPIIFTAESVRAIQDGRKMQTRRLVKVDALQSHWDKDGWEYLGTDDTDRHVFDHPRAIGSLSRIRGPYGKPGDRLFVREGLYRPDGDPWRYRADGKPVMVNREDETAMVVWAHHKQENLCPSMFMPRWASRLTLEITGVRVERLQEISEQDARAEGIQVDDCGHAIRPDDDINWGSAVGAYAELWNSINKKTPWSSNPWVWVLEFKKVA